ncbi:MAG: tetratricopeptide repeat protein [Opitutales bacterium]
MNNNKAPINKAKNKISDIKTKEEDFEVVDQNTADERKTVIADSDFENLEFDDRVWLWWKEYKFSAIVSVIAALAIIVLVNGHRMLQQKAITDAQAAYSQCTDDASLEKFISEFGYSELAGVAAMTLADKEYNNSNFAKAQELYAKALRSLDKSELAAKALIGEAFAMIKQGKTDEATIALEKVAQAEKVNATYKAQATFELAVLEYTKGAKDVSKAILDKLIQNPQAGIWASKAQNFIKTNF